MAHSIQIIVREDCNNTPDDPNRGLEGTIIDSALTIIPDEGDLAGLFQDILEAWAWSRKRPAQIDNPDFNPELEESEENPRLIDNPESLVRGMLVGFREESKTRLKAMKKRQGKRQLDGQVDAGAESFDDAIVVLNGPTDT